MRKLPRSSFSTRSTRRRGFSPLVLVGVLVTVVIALAVGGVVFLLPRMGSHAAGAVNADCTLIVPANPLTAQGLETPYQLMATNPNNGPCNEANPNQSAFVQAAVIDRATGNISVYEPLVIDQGTNPAAAPTMPKLNATSVVGIWFGFNGNNLTLQGTNNSLQQGNCVNGISGSIFGQFSYCNAPAFFRAANHAIAAGKLAPPPLGTAKDAFPVLLCVISVWWIRTRATMCKRNTWPCPMVRPRSSPPLTSKTCKTQPSSPTQAIMRYSPDSLIRRWDASPGKHRIWPTTGTW